MTNSKTETPSDQKPKESKISQIVNLVNDFAKLWHTPDRRAFVSIPFDNGSIQNLRIGGSEFKYRVSEAFRLAHNSLASPRTLKDASEVLGAIAVIDGAEFKAHLRVARQNDVIYVDLGDPEWRIVRIDGTGWEVTQDCPVKFIRPQNFAALPVPSKNGDLNNLRNLLPNLSDEGWVLIQGFLVGVYDPTGTQPVLVLTGGQGSGKSSAVNLIKALTDPNLVASRSIPKKIDELFIATEHARIPVFDNVSHLTGEQSDALCQIASGGGYGKRMLFTDADEVAIETRQPVIANGITDFVTRPDLDQRCLHVELQTIEPTQRMLDSELSDQFDSVKSSILGAVFDAVSTALRHSGETRLEERPRLAELAEFVSAAEPNLVMEPGDFASVLKRQSIERSMSRSEMEPVIVAVNRLLSLVESHSFDGTYKELLDQVEAELPQRVGGWTPLKLSAEIKRLVPDFKVAGIEVTRSGRTNRGSRVRITKL
jgi:putative DNA primase/helicase